MMHALPCPALPYPSPPPCMHKYATLTLAPHLSHLMSQVCAIRPLTFPDIISSLQHMCTLTALSLAAWHMHAAAGRLPVKNRYQRTFTAPRMSVTNLLRTRPNARREGRSSDAAPPTEATRPVRAACAEACKAGSVEVCGASPSGQSIIQQAGQHIGRM